QVLLSFHLGAFSTPVLEPLPCRAQERETCLQPEMKLHEGEGRAQVQRRGDHTERHDIGADQVEVMDEEIGKKLSNYTLNRNCVQPAKMSRQQSHERRNE